MQDLCLKCSRRAGCGVLCATALSYAGQDTVGRDYGVYLVDDCDRYSEPFSWGSGKSNARLIYELYFLDRKSVRGYITCYVNLSSAKIFDIVKRMRRSIVNDGTLKSKILHLHFHKGKSPSQIKRYLKCSQAYVYEVIDSYVNRF